MDRIVIQKYGVNSLGADPDWIKEVRYIPFESTTPDGFIDSTKSEVSIFNRTKQHLVKDWVRSLHTEIVSLSASKFKDYKAARTQLKTLITAKGGFNSLTTLEKQKACEWFIPLPTEIMNFYQVDMSMTLEEARAEKRKNGTLFREHSTKARNKRFYALYDFVRNNVDRETDLELISQDLGTYQFEATYVTLGREGTMKTNYEGVPDLLGLFDYVQGSQNWIDAGLPTFASRVTTPLWGYTTQEIVDEAIDILDNGNY